MPFFSSGGSGGGLDPSLFLPKSGGTMTGPLILHVDPAAPLGAATKQYVDAHAGGAPYIHVESPAETDWVIVHQLNFRYVQVQVVDSAGNTVIPDIIYTDANRTDLLFANPVEGTAILRR